MTKVLSLKKTGLRILSALLCLSMLAGFVPGHVVTAYAAGDEISFSFVDYVDASYAGNKYLASGGAMQPYQLSPNNYFASRTGSKGNWIAFDLGEIPAGDFDVDFKYSKNAFGAKGDIYIAKVDEFKTGDINTALAENSSVATVDFYSQEWQKNVSEKVSVKDLEGGRYVFVVKVSELSPEPQVVSGVYYMSYVYLENVSLVKTGEYNPGEIDTTGMVPSDKKVVINFTKAKASIPDTKYEDTDDVFEFASVSPDWTIADGDLLKYAAYMQIRLGNTDRFISFKVKIPAKGYYNAVVNHLGAYLGGQTEFYMLPPDVEAKKENLIEKYRMGDIRSHRDIPNGEKEENDAYSPLKNGFNAQEAGIYTLVIKNKATFLNGSGNYTYLKSLTLDGVADVSMEITPSIINEGDNAQVSVTAVNGSGLVFDLSDICDYAIDDEGVAKVEAGGKITALSLGSAGVTASIELGGVRKEYTAILRVVEEGYIPTLDSVDFSTGKEAIDVGDTGNIAVSGKYSDGFGADLRNAQIAYSSTNTEIFEVVDGVYTAKAEGVVELTVTVTDSGVTKSVTKPVSVGQPSGEKVTLNFNAAVNGIVGTGYTNTKNTYKFNSLSPGWEAAEGDLIKYNLGTQIRMGKDLNRWVAFDVNIPAAGWYFMELEHGAHYLGGLMDVYMIPKNGISIPDGMIEKYRVGEILFNREQDNENTNAYSAIGMFFAEYTGEYTLVFKNKQTFVYGYAHYMYLINMTLTGYKAFSSIELTADKNDLTLGEGYNEEVSTSVTAKYNNGEDINLSDLSIQYKSSDHEIASVSADGVIRAESEGTAEITVSAVLDGITRSSSVKVNVTDTSNVLGVYIEAPKELYVRGSCHLKFKAKMSSGKTITIPDSAEKNISLSANPQNAATVDEEGKIVTNEEGEITVSATVMFKGAERTAEAVTIPIVSSKKSGVTIYTEQQRAAMRENAANITVYKNQARSYVAAADEAVKNLDLLYDMIVAEGLPRFYDVGSQGDPNRDKCKYCNTDINVKHGLYQWRIDPLNAPWKIQCPECRRKFPSNDFGRYYYSGLDKKGVFNPELANKGLLVNELYPEMGEGWGVDDGWGYRPGGTLENGQPERHIYIAVYLHQLWYGNESTGAGLIRRSILNLANAYLYTNKIEYGRAGAILLDRVADFYPDYDWYKWHEFRGDNYRGTILDPVWGTGIAKQLAEWYDVFYPAYEDEGVISYLSEKAKKYEMNPKYSAAAIRTNAEQGILYAIFDHARKNNLLGNFGTDQAAVTAAAVALDTKPETNEWLDWVMAYGGGTNTGPEPTTLRAGGNVKRQLIDSVDRDGMGYEAAPGYNAMWVSYLMPIAELLADYKGYTEVNLWDNPKFVKMFDAQLPLVMSGTYTVQIGDDGSFASTGIGISLDTVLTAYRRLGDYRFAQLAYYLNGNKVDGLMYPATVKDPESIQDEVQEVIDRYGEISIGSDMMPGYGFSAIRDGGKYDRLNTHRGFWMYYGLTGVHGHADSLNLGMDAFGLNFAPDFGYPSDTAVAAPASIQWLKSTLCHNTVMVDTEEQKRNRISTESTPMHFDDAGRVKVMDTDRATAYPQTEVYRRTVVMVDVDDTVSYGVDFFRIVGGDDHIYSFHSQSDEIFETEGLESIVKQGEVEDGKFVYKGSYAGPDVPKGPDPYTDYNNIVATGLKYGPGLSWLYNVRRDSAPENDFAVDFAVTDFRKTTDDRDGLHLRLTMTNDYPMTEVALAKGDPSQYYGNPQGIEFLLARRTGRNLDTLYTAVLEPYRHSRYLEKIESVSAVTSETVGRLDTAKAVKVTHKDGKRVDYIIYATNNNVTYRIDDKFDFRGFVGVVTYDKNGQLVYSYLNDGDVLIDSKPENKAYTGFVKGFTGELSAHNEMTLSMDGEVDIEKLKGRFIYVDNFSAENAAYKIEDAYKNPDGTVVVSTGRTTFIKSSLASPYLYSIAVGQKFRIPLSETTDTAPVFASVEKQNVATDSKVSVTVSATGQPGRTVTLKETYLPRGATFNPLTGEISWVPDKTQIGEYYAAIEASDGVLSTVQYIRFDVHKGVGGGSAGNSTGDGAAGGNSGADNVTGGDNTGSGTPGGNGGGAGGGGAGGGGGAPSGGNTGSTEGDNKPSDTDKPESGEQGGGTAEGEQFTDLGNYSWAKEAIYALVEKGVVKGTGANTYSPAKNIKRADFAIMLTRAFGITEGDADQFADVDASMYYAEELRLAKSAGIVAGVGENKFNPDGEISRQDMMVMLYRALKAQGYELSDADHSVLAEFADAATIADYAKDAVSALVKARIIGGSQGMISPLAKATRAEIAVMLSRSIKAE